MASPRSQQLILVLGATGLIGQSVTAALSRHDYRVRGLARCAGSITRAQKYVEWHYADLKEMQSPSRWQPVIADCTAIVNVAGVLQHGNRDDLQVVHLGAIAALVDACGQLGGKRRLVHISAPGADAEASTAFYRTKAAGDRAVRQGAPDWVILRPAFVLAPHAYGASALLRALASFPLVIPLVHANSLVQTTAVDDVAQAVCMAVDGKIPAGTDVVLAEGESHRLSEVVAALRSWLGLSLRPVMAVPAWAALVVSKLADAAGYLGWRSPLRSTATKVASGGVIGDTGEWTRITGLTCRSLQETLDLLPATVQERWFARLYLIKPVIVLVLALLWLASGSIALFKVDAAAVTLIGAGVTPIPAKVTVIAGALADIGVGLACLHRRTHERALYGMIGLTLLYLLAATYFTPALWADPFGSLVKAIPAAVLALVALAISPER